MPTQRSGSCLRSAWCSWACFEIPFFFANVFDIESPANFVFVYVIAVLVLREFYTTVEVSQLRAKVRNLVQNEALIEASFRMDDVSTVEHDVEEAR